MNRKFWTYQMHQHTRKSSDYSRPWWSWDSTMGRSGSRCMLLHWGSCRCCNGLRFFISTYSWNVNVADNLPKNVLLLLQGHIPFDLSTVTDSVLRHFWGLIYRLSMNNVIWICLKRINAEMERCTEESKRSLYSPIIGARILCSNKREGQSHYVRTLTVPISDMRFGLLHTHHF